MTSKKRHKKQIVSLQEEIDTHAEKIRKEEGKNVPDVNLIKYWLREIETFRVGIKKAEKRLKRG